MKKPYSANELLNDFAKHLGFKSFIFDDPEEFGPEIKLVDETKNGEIDAVLLYRNVVCVVGIDKSEMARVIRERKSFFEKLDKTEKEDDLKLKLKVTKKTEKTVEGEEAAKKQLDEVKRYLEKMRQEYDVILKKIFFCPLNRMDKEEMDKFRNEGKIVIDKDIYDYFKEVLKRLSKRFLFADFMRFLGIRKIDLEKRSPSKTKKPRKSAPFVVNRLELEKDRIIMYSLPISVEDIVDHVFVQRIASKYDKNGFQRMVKPDRLTKINEEYLSKNETFPNNVIIALDPEVYTNESDFYDKEKGELTFFDEYTSLIIIDGQHRFFSFVKGKKMKRPILATLIFFNDGNLDESSLSMLKMFYKINKTQERIDPNLSFALKAKIDPNSEDCFWYSVFTNLDKIGFFAKRFSFREAAMRKKGEPTSIVSVVTYGGVLRLNKSYKKKGTQVDGLDAFYGRDRQQNIDFASNLLKNYFDVVEEVLYDQGVNKKALMPREIGALIRLIRHFMISKRSELNSLGKVKDITKEKKPSVAEIKKILSNIQFKDAVALEYGASNWAALEGYMLKCIHKIVPDFGDKNLLSKKGLEIYEGI